MPDQTAGARVAGWGDAQAAVAPERDKRQSVLWPRLWQLVGAEGAFDPNDDGVPLNRLVKVQQLCRSTSELVHEVAVCRAVVPAKPGDHVCWRLNAKRIERGPNFLG